MKKLLIATRSRGKFPEMTALLAGLPFELMNLNDLPELENFTVEEVGTTFEGNALLKAILYGKKANLLTLADDSGLEVDALSGRPGVYSARYAPGSDKDRYEKLLEELRGVPEADRTARFRAVVAVYDPENDRVRLAEGTAEGRILTTPEGSNGFGYDPVFWNAKMQKGNAEMTFEEKNICSHRGEAFEKIRDILKQDF
ncbi:MAG TPA: RdgB/HAM1 family non-canonical purine NTP pyrophosphatase [Candidatus Paceibacterota bacterium]|nr:RdgB/HAM1 family non-canonical purine NTP pyrophosphatase [Candidatus Paceibacterota bacterium]